MTYALTTRIDRGPTFHGHLAAAIDAFGFDAKRRDTGPDTRTEVTLSHDTRLLITTTADGTGLRLTVEDDCDETAENAENDIGIVDLLARAIVGLINTDDLPR